jgi:1-acyl-sn-glycerol-3-phosphate acyltransferase
MKNEWEWAVALISLTITILWVFYPLALESPVTQWFYVQTHTLINTPVLGWIFKIAGFFFLLATLIRFLAAITWVLNPKKTTQASDAEDFDPFEEIK